MWIVELYWLECILTGVPNRIHHGTTNIFPDAQVLLESGWAGLLIGIFS